MRILALQTNVHLLKKQFIPEGEHEILTTTRHPLRFILPFFAKTILYIASTFLLGFSSFFLEGIDALTIILSVYLLCFLVYLYQVFKSFIAWRYNFLIITSEKAIIIEHRSFFYQNVQPIHLDNVASSKVESQLLGIFRCGIVYISLKEKEGSGSTREIRLDYIPHPAAVASAIENAIALKQQRKQGTETPQQQEQKVETVKETLKEVETPVEAR